MPSMIARRESRLIAFLDLTQFSRAVHGLEPEAVFAFLQDYYAQVAAKIGPSGGRIIKCIGDALLCDWPEASVDAGVRGLLDLRDFVAASMKKRAKPCKLDVKAHFGEVAVGPMGAPGEEREDVIGETVNIAAMLKSAGFAVTAEVFRKLKPETRKLLKKHTPPITYIPLEDPHRD